MHENGAARQFHNSMQVIGSRDLAGVPAQGVFSQQQTIMLVGNNTPTLPLHSKPAPELQNELDPGATPPACRSLSLPDRGTGILPVSAGVMGSARSYRHLAVEPRPPGLCAARTSEPFSELHQCAAVPNPKNAKQTGPPAWYHPSAAGSQRPTPNAHRHSSASAPEGSWLSLTAAGAAAHTSVANPQITKQTSGSVPGLARRRVDA
jgi:hypothetical protein